MVHIRKSHVLIATAAGLLVIVGFVFLVVGGAGDPSAENSTSGREKSFNNSGKTENRFAGSSACTSCHPAHHESYILSAHSRAMSLVDPAREPSDGVFIHQATGRRYTAERKNGLLWHTEIILSDSGNSPASERLQADSADIGLAHPLKYLVGSGRHSRTYLTEADGFLIESPLTWYSSTEKWSMSPGYDHSQHSSFERAADEGCLICHAGQISSVDGALNRLLITEAAIGCERCHGPGGRHVDKWSPGDLSGAKDEPDETIAHPARLSRDRSEAICAQCHLRGDATVFHQGRGLSDFQPGMLLTDVRIDYQFASSDGSMKVVGHVDQMHASRCYQSSTTLTCTTCHEMHASQVHQSAVSVFRAKCLSCHTTSSCRLEEGARRTKSSDDNCLQCHMPQVETDIPHIAFTHHRIGIHNKSSEAREPRVTTGDLVPFDGSAGLTGNAARRSLGLACAEFAAKQLDASMGLEYRRRAKDLLQGLANSPEEDGEVLAVLAKFAWEEDNAPRATELASRAIKEKDLSPGAKTNSLLIAADSFLQLRQSAKAAQHLEHLVTLRRNSQDWFLLGIARFQTGQHATGLDAIRKAIAIQPFRPELYQTLADMLRSLGQAEEARLPQQRATLLRSGRQTNQ